MANPVFEKGAMFRPVSTIGERVPAAGLTYGDVIGRTAQLFAVLLGAAVFGWFFPQVLWVSVIVALALGLVNGFRKKVSPLLILGYSLFEGLVLGSLTEIVERITPGVAIQAVAGTLSVFAVVLVAFAMKLVRETKLLNKIFFIAISGYLLFSLVNLGLMMLGVNNSAWGLNSSITIFGIPLGIITGVAAVLMASYSLVMDFTFIQNSVERGAEKKVSWYAAYGLLVDIVWIYVELLRIFAQLARR